MVHFSTNFGQVGDLVDFDMADSGKVAAHDNVGQLLQLVIPEIKEDHPGISSKDISKLSDQMWKNIGARERAGYEAIAAEEQRGFIVRHARYRYKSRRPGQIRRRGKAQTSHATSSNAQSSNRGAQ
ncbi:hypothetical protein SLS62_003361 [Diatrype stigma]|uniref:HMG box domain-containing protein n=1 Tax=Diatrype stigma TaxID=117547 RepID=A0AAN9YPX8_9PEZI